jgi:hypothetical protein
MKEIKIGILDPFCETGTEGIIWCLYHGDFTEDQWDLKYQTQIKVGDHLKILGSNKDILWEGIVKYDRTCFENHVGFDDTIDFEIWMQYFDNQNLAILTKNYE